MPRIAFLFPGQGSQSVGMGRSLYENTPVGRRYFEIADEKLGRPLSKICFEGPEEELKRSVNTQPALLVVSAILADVLRQEELEPEACAGHSLGEYSALYAAGSLTLEAALELVSLRGEKMSEAAEGNPGAMAAVMGLDRVKTEEACEAAGGVVGLANDNCPGQLVISGEEQAVLRACEEAQQRGAKRAIPLPVQGAYHSPLMESGVGPMKSALERTDIKPPAVTVISNVEARPYGGVGEIRQLLTRQITSPVRWTETIQYLVGEGFDLFVEVGQGSVLTGLMKRIDRNVRAVSVQNEQDVQKLVEELGA